MANEARVQSTLTLQKVSGSIVLMNEQRGRSFAVDVDGTKGPTPGAVLVPTTGVDIDLAELTTPGLCCIENQDATNYIEVGIREPSSGFFYPLMEIGPGEAYVIKLSRNIQEEYTGTGTGTSTPGNFLHLKANTASVNAVVAAYEK